MKKLDTLLNAIQSRFSAQISNAVIAWEQLTLEVPAEHIIAVATALRDEPAFLFDQLIDLCGVDYLTYGQYDWEGEEAPTSSFNRGLHATQHPHALAWTKPRFAVVYHLLSTQHNLRVRLKVYLHEEDLHVSTMIPVWPCANWFEREVFDLYGIWFDDHPDLRRILTDYGFIGHPFRKDFPLIGKVEMRYDAKAQRCVYEPVSIEPRTLVPRVFREDSRYDDGQIPAVKTEGEQS